VLFTKLISSPSSRSYSDNISLSLPSPLLSQEVAKRRREGPPILPLPQPEGELERRGERRFSSFL